MKAPLPPDRAEQLRQLFDQVVALPPSQRAAFVDQACRDDPALRRELTSLLDHAGEASRPSEEEMGELAGQRIRHYQITQRLGGGGMGVVYQARDTRLDRTVALKFLPPELTRDRQAKARFVQEAKAASALDHSNICTIYEIGETQEGQLFIAMAHYQGETLKKKIERGPLPVEEALAYAIAIAEGLAAAHAAGIVHRDVKPANVMVPDQGPVKLLDFGLAKMAGQTQLTQEGSTVGTVAYMSPEQARGEAVDARTDLWSLGVVLYEMLTGRRPFRGAYHQAVIYSILNEAAEPVRQANPVVPPEVAQIVERAMQKDPTARYGSAANMLADLKAYQRRLRAVELGALDVRTMLRRVRKPQVLIPAVGVLLLAVLAAGWFFDRQAKIRWARQEVLPEVEWLVEARDYTEAYALAEQAERYLPDNPELATLMAQSSLHIDIETEPSGAEVYMKEYATPEAEWKHMGVTPIDSLRVPVGIFRWKLEKEGYETVLAAASTWDVSREQDREALLVSSDLVRVLDEAGSLPEGMVRVQGAETPYGPIGDFFIDRYEVTNRQFKAFVDAGGYRNRDYWQHAFVRDGQELTWEEAMAAFVDQTGRPGPAAWQAGDYPEGQGDYPVSGVSWYEAAAYAAFAGKSLPTGTHWGLARGEATTLIRWPQLGGLAIFMPFSNFNEAGPVAIENRSGITAYGAYDMAGNVREWCWNETAKGRLIRGGAWNDNPYMFNNLSQAPPFDRSPKNGFRCATYPDADTIPAPVFAPTPLPATRDYAQEEPVSDDIFQVYKNQFAYDKTPLHASVEARDTSAQDWIYEKINVDAAYGNERMTLHLFLPTNVEPPFQTVVYFPGGASKWFSSSENLTSYHEFLVFLSFLVKNGRAVLYPVYKGSFERQDMTLARLERTGRDTHQFAEFVIQWVKDFKRSVDYLETREDIDTDRLAYYGMSWGGWIGPIVTAVEERLKASILAPGALLPVHHRPEVDPINYVTRVRVPTLMLNGRYDSIVPLELGIRPLYDLLGTPAEHKALKLYETDHIPPRNEYIKETLAWLDRYLGPAK